MLVMVMEGNLLNRLSLFGWSGEGSSALPEFSFLHPVWLGGKKPIKNWHNSYAATSSPSRRCEV